ncbi:MAG TPA: hypothetical protein VKB88_35620 [Bryobacteraceae bacterium]|nr:hypothetical protein [Bryobacteraceae bacterium]
MRNLLVTALTGSGLLFGGLTLTAQNQYRYRSDQYSYSEQQSDQQTTMFNRLRRDLDRVSDNSIAGTGDHLRIDRARQEINELQARVDNGTFDERDIDHAVMAVQRVLDDNHMPDWARNRLSDDLGQLRNFR